MNINYIKLNKNASVPVNGTEFSAGADLRASIESDVTINPGQTEVVGTGIAIEIPNGYFGMICPRSGLSLKHGITLLNSPGIIDSDYRGEIKCIIINHSNTNFTIENGMRIAQIIVMEYKKPVWVESEVLQDSIRGSSGFGSTGLL
jgi:dUTP pyrophosphatase